MTSYQNQYPAPGQYPAQPTPQQYPPQPAPGMPPQGAQMPPQQPMPPQGYQQPPPQQYAQPGPPQGPPQGMPAFHDVDDAAAAQAYAQVPASNFGPNPPFLRVPGPRGQQTWDNSVPLGYTGSLTIRILPPWGPGKPVFVESKTHFYKSHKYPKGRVIGYQGEDSLFSLAILEAAKSPDPRLQRIATDYGRVRVQYFYNVLDLDHGETHYGQDGVMRPYVLAVGKNLHRDIGQLAEHRGGLSRLVHPQTGRNLRYSKTKAGSETMNVEYSVLDNDPSPIHEYYFPALQNLWDLETQIQNPSQDDVMEAIRELGLPMPTTVSAQVPQGYPAQAPTAAYQPDPNPPYQNPYAAQEAAFYGGPPPAQQAGAPPPPSAMQQPAQQAAASMPQPPPMQQFASPPAGPPPVYGGAPPSTHAAPPAPPAQAGAPPATHAAPPPTQAPPMQGQFGAPPQPPPMQPPPVSSGGAAPSGYAPQGSPQTPF